MKVTQPFRIVGSLVVTAVLLGACASAPKKEESAATSKNADFLACQVTDTGGIDDKSFNQTAYKGLTDAEDQLGVTSKFLESTSPNDFQTNIKEFMDQDCDLIVTVGFLLADATAAAAKANPDQDFAIVDYAYYSDSGKKITYKNIKELTFQTDEAAFQAGYLAAGMTKSGKVGTFGGINIPTVTIFMNGFAGGVNYYNQQNDDNVQVLGWDVEKQDGLFTGDFENQDKGRQVTQTLLNQGADIILPVAGPVGLGAGASVQDAGGAYMVWVDTDGCISAAEFCDLFLTSIEKHMDVAVSDTIKAAVDGSFKGGLYTGTLANEGVGIAPYHELESKVPASLDKDVQTIEQDIISGKLDITKYMK